MTMTFRKLSELSMEENVRIWNLGFEGYFIQMVMTIDALMTRIVNEGLSLENSLAIYVDGEPAGFVLNGFRDVDGKKVAWNGGTGIVPAFRGQGIGRALMLRNLELYREQGVELALLEALTQNESAIKLYQYVGYEITDRLMILQHTGTIDPQLLKRSVEHPFSITKGLPRDVYALDFYRGLSAWQTQWPSMKEGESIIIRQDSEPVCYALYKRTFDQEGKMVTISLYQCEVLPGREDAEEIYKLALSELFAPLDYVCRRGTSNLRKSNQPLNDLLIKLGFTTNVEQVFMMRNMDLN
ncbi:GNAT family N-acetyltransferase [Paenibacillus sp. AD87]|uniref:GNAT family N-acetyltransferase n=1 Tax=Paenibacillus sp. AD87 TaxID=1528787 RepID=UPI0007FF3C01|nr:GNAT family N-acetyltransferase [Paenibacillus sp. AD87]OAX48367.1 Acetyltransferase YpeA [Paenibacillus sp. AD87]